jgi:hypothetical protein
MGDVDGDAPLLLLGRLVDLVEGGEGGLARGVALGQGLGDGGGERRLAMVDVTNRADVDVGFCAVEFFFGHRESSPLWRT